MDVQVKFDERKLNEVRAMLRSVPNALPKVISQGINKTATSAKTEIKRKITGEVNVKTGSVARRITKEKATVNKWLARLGISLKRISVISFKGTKQTKKGVTYRIDKGGARKLVPAAFITTARRTGSTGVFKRMSDSRYPLAWLRGPSLGQVFENASGVASGVVESSSRMLEKNIDDQIRRRLSKKS